MAETFVSKVAEFSSDVNPAMELIYDDATTRHRTPIVLAPSAVGIGCSVYSVVCGASDNDASIKASAGQVYGYSVYSAETTPVFVKLYNKASAPTVGSDTPMLRFGIPEEAVADGGVQISEWWPQGVAFDTGIAIAVLASLTDAGTSALASADLTIVNIFYK